ncbi:hypothetical protein F2Q70_00045088 [Brassica cretica]|uniref:Uncharacterized protein n=1 Tax=Brassica cretica TaxID=69181 RepID=A0A8S9KG55_BRACR|nr:hypothetical protein F2Q70_00045088 [Brassica cretica]
MPTRVQCQQSQNIYLPNSTLKLSLTLKEVKHLPVYYTGSMLQHMHSSALMILPHRRRDPPRERTEAESSSSGEDHETEAESSSTGEDHDRKGESSRERKREAESSRFHHNEAESSKERIAKRGTAEGEKERSGAVDFNGERRGFLEDSIDKRGVAEGEKETSRRGREETESSKEKEKDAYNDTCPITCAACGA